MKKFGVFLIGLVVLAVGAAFLLNRPSNPPKTYSFLEGATLVESVKKDPRYGGGQRDVYEISGDLNEVLERVRKEVAPNSRSASASLTAVTYFQDKETTVIVAAGRAMSWKDYSAAHVVTAKEQAAREMLQMGASFLPKLGIVTIMIDRPYAEIASGALTKLNRTLSPPDPNPAMAMGIKLVRTGKDVEAEVTITNHGNDTQDEYVLRSLKIGGLVPKGLPAKVTGLKPGASHVERFGLPGVSIKGKTVPFRVEVTEVYKGKSQTHMSGGSVDTP